MSKVIKFPKDKIEYSDRFYRKVDPKALTHHITMLHPKLSPKVAHAIALALVYTTYVELVLDEEQIPQEIVGKIRNNDFKSFIDRTSDKTVN
jgi:hypothetical protein